MCSWLRLFFLNYFNDMKLLLLKIFTYIYHLFSEVFSLVHVKSTLIYGLLLLSTSDFRTRYPYTWGPNRWVNDTLERDHSQWTWKTKRHRSTYSFLLGKDFYWWRVKRLRSLRSLSLCFLVDSFLSVF